MKKPPSLYCAPGGKCPISPTSSYATGSLPGESQARSQPPSNDKDTYKIPI